MLMACVPCPGNAGPQATRILVAVTTHTRRSEPQRSDHSHFPSSASHVAIQRDCSHLLVVIDLPLKRSARWWLYHRYLLSINLVVVLWLIHMARELTIPRLPQTLAIKNNKSAPERNSGSAYYPRRAYVF